MFRAALLHLQTYLITATWRRAALWVCGAVLLLPQAHAQAKPAKREAEAIHRCAGPPVFFTSDPLLIRNSRCEPLGNRPLRADSTPKLWQDPGKPAARAGTEPRVTAGPSPPPAAASGPASAPGLAKARPATVVPAPAAKAVGNHTISPAQQKERDSDRVAILRHELDNEQRKLAELQERLRAAQQSSEPGKATRIASVQKDISRTESDIQALTREYEMATR